MLLKQSIPSLKRFNIALVEQTFESERNERKERKEKKRNLVIEARKWGCQRARMQVRGIA
jgi:hypothetical protein